MSQDEQAKLAGKQPIRLEEAALVEKVKAGQTEAYEVLVRRYQDRVFNACWRISGHLEDARDLTQEAFLKAFEGLGGFRHQSSFYTWVFRIAVNLALSHRRKSGKRSSLSLDQPFDEGSSQAASLSRQLAAESGESPDRAASQAETHAAVSRALQSLEMDFRLVLILRDIEGFGYQDIAEVLGVPAGTVKSRIFRARMALKEAMGAQPGPRATGDSDGS